MGKPPTRAKGAPRLNATPELIANIRERYEHSDERLATMAADLGCCGETVRHMAKREGWVRYVAPPRDLSPAARLRVRAEALADPLHLPLEGERGGVSDRESSPPPDCDRFATAVDLPPPGGGEERAAGGGEKEEVPPGGGEEREARGGEQSAQSADTAHLHATIASQMLHEVAGFLDDVRAERKRMKREGYAKHELQAVSRVIADLSGSLNRLKPMAQRAAEPDTGTFYDDMPADLDAYREALARKIEAFMASRGDEADAFELDADRSGDA